MAELPRRRTKLIAGLLAFCSLAAGCASSASNKYFGKTVAPKNNVLRYVTGSEPETLDPHVSSGQPEARLYMALYDGLIDYGPRDMQPVPAIAKSWEVSSDFEEFIFHLRDNAKFSDGTPITARDFVYSFRRAFEPKTISSTTELGFDIKYAKAFNTKQVFVKKGEAFLLEKDLGGKEAPPSPVFGPESEFNNFIRSPARVTLPADEKERSKILDADPNLKTAVEGAEFIPVAASDIGIEAVDDYTVRITLRQSAPYFIGLLAHQLFRLVPQHVVKKWGKLWTRPEHIVTSGSFRVKDYRPYDTLVLERDPNNWDAANVHLDGIEFYPVEDNTTILNLYKAGSIDAFFNHVVLTSWIDQAKEYPDEYLDFPENAVAYYAMNTTRPPFDDIRVRKAFARAVDNEALSDFRKVTKPLYGLVPSGIFPEYDAARLRVGEEIRKERNLTPEAWAKYGKFDADAARKMLTDAGFPVQKNGDSFECPTFPTDKVSILFNTNENNRAIAEFVQAELKRNLGITIPLRSIEFKTFLPERHELQYVGIAQSLWSGDYMDPFSFLNLHYGFPNNGDAGFNDPKYNKMLDEANSELDPTKRFEMLARAEYYLMDQQPSIPLTINATNWMKKPYVKGLYPNPGTLLPWKFVYIEQDPAKWDKDVENIMTTPNAQVDKQLEELTATQKTAAK